jgi:hypothetical protein
MYTLAIIIDLSTLSIGLQECFVYATDIVYRLGIQCSNL